jgi:predicted ATPase
VIGRSEYEDQTKEITHGAVNGCAVVADCHAPVLLSIRYASIFRGKHKVKTAFESKETLEKIWDVITFWN